MDTSKEKMTILMAEDDEDDRLLTAEALNETRLSNPLAFVHDGEELLDYLYARKDYAPPNPAPRPGLILLDLNMPRKNGRQALKEIKADPDLRKIPVVVLTTSKEVKDIQCLYDLGVNSFITKPVTFESLVEVMKALQRYWFEIVELPSQKARYGQT